jgi:hypothetical protein
LKPRRWFSFLDRRRATQLPTLPSDEVIINAERRYLTRMFHFQNLLSAAAQRWN